MAGDTARSLGPKQLILVRNEIYTIPRIMIGLRKGNKLIPRGSRIEAERSIWAMPEGQPFRIEMHYDGKEVSTEVWVRSRTDSLHVYEYNPEAHPVLKVCKLMHHNVAIDYALKLQHERAVQYIKTDRYPSFNEGYGGW